MTRKDVVQNQVSFYYTTINNLIFGGILGTLFLTFQSSDHNYNKFFYETLIIILVCGFGANVLMRRQIKLLDELYDLP